MGKIKICLDAGHYAEYNRSPVVPEYYESHMTWKLHLMLKQYLEQYGIEVITTRPDQRKDLALYQRGATSKGCDLFLSLHSNAVGGKIGNENVDRVMVYGPINGKGKDIAGKLGECIRTVMQTKQGSYVETRKGNRGDYYGVIRGATAVGTIGLLVEHSFHTCTRSAKWLLDDTNLDKLARAEAQVLAEHYGLAKQPEDPPDPPDPPEPEKPEEEPKMDKLYRVQVGAFSVRDNAQKMLEKLKALGFDGLIVEAGQGAGQNGTTITDGTWNVRNGPGRQYGIVGLAQEGEVYELSGDEQGDWVGILYKGIKAWISRSGVASK